MPPKKKGIAKPKKAANAAPTRRNTGKKATAASDNNGHDVSSPPAPIRVNTAPTNRQRTRARVAAAKGTKDISPVLPVELGADPDAFARKVASGKTSMYHEEKVEGKAEQQDANGEATAAEAEKDSVDEAQQTTKQTQEQQQITPPTDTTVAEVEAMQQPQSAQVSPVNNPESPGVKHESSVSPIVGHYSFVIEIASSAHSPASTSTPQQSPTMREQRLAARVVVPTGFEVMEKHRTPVGTVAERRTRAHELFEEIRDQTLDPRDIPYAYRELSDLYRDLTILDEYDGDRSRARLYAQYKEELDRVGPTVPDDNHDDDTVKDRQLRMLNVRIARYHKRAQDELLVFPRLHPTWGAIDLENSYKRLSSLHSDLIQLHQLRGDAQLPAEMETYQSTLTKYDSVGQRIRAQQEADDRQQAEYLANLETETPAEKQKAPAAKPKSPVAEQQSFGSPGHDSAAGSKRQRTSVDSGEVREDVAKRQKPEEAEDAVLKEFLDSTHNDAVEDFQPPAAAGQAIAEAREAPNASAFGVGADFERRPSNNKTTIDGSESEDDDGSKSLFEGSDDGQDVTIRQQDAAAPPKPIVSSTVINGDLSRNARKLPVESQPAVTTPKSATSPPVTARPHTPSSSVASPTTGGSPSMRKGLALPPRTPTSPTSSPVVPQAQASSSRQASQSPTTLPLPAAQRSASGSRIAPPTTLTEDESEPVPACRPLTEPDSLNKAIEYTTKGSPEFAQRIEGKTRSPSIIIDGDDAASKTEAVPDFQVLGEEKDDVEPEAESDTGRAISGVLSGRRVGPPEDGQQARNAPALRSLEELLRADGAARMDDDGEDQDEED